MNPKFWGSSAWRFIHSITFNYGDKHGIPSEKEKDIYKMYFRLLPYIIPCDSCSESFLCICKETPVDNYLNCRKDLIMWAYIIHNKVNNKLQNTNENSEIDFKTFYNFYKKNINETSNNNENVLKQYFLKN
jgi:hypothetical protein